MTNCRPEEKQRSTPLMKTTNNLATVEPRKKAQLPQNKMNNGPSGKWPPSKSSASCWATAYDSGSMCRGCYSARESEWAS